MGELHTDRHGITSNWQLEARRIPTLLSNLSRHVERQGEKATFFVKAQGKLCLWGECQISFKARKRRYGSLRTLRIQNAYSETVVCAVEIFKEAGSGKKLGGKKHR